VIGSQFFFLFNSSVKPKGIEGNKRFPIFLFSIFFAMNIAIGNMSLRWVSVNFNQVMRALVPAIVMIIGIIFLGKKYSSSRKWAVVPIIFGVALTFYGEMHFTAVGSFYTILCVVLAAAKAVMSGELLTGDLKLHPIDLVNKMCPLALIQTAILCVVSGEAIEIAGR
jgi:drug/metabolite transporter (DMT)-like permease